MFPLYQHKKKLFLLLSQEDFQSRYALPYYPQEIPKDSLQITRYARQIKVWFKKPACWIALVSDAGMQLRYIEPHQPSVAIFPLQNEQPLFLLFGINSQIILRYLFS